MSEVVECIECGEQCRIHDTDGGHCKSCGGECHDLDAIYGKEGLHPDSDFIKKSARELNVNIKLTEKQSKVLEDCIKSSLGYLSTFNHSIQSLRALEKKGLGKVVHGLFFYINDAGRSIQKELTEE